MQGVAFPKEETIDRADALDRAEVVIPLRVIEGGPVVASSSPAEATTGVPTSEDVPPVVERASERLEQGMDEPVPLAVTRKRPSTPMWWTVMGSAVVAVGAGVAFGWVVLAMLSAGATRPLGDTEARASTVQEVKEEQIARPVFAAEERGAVAQRDPLPVAQTAAEIAPVYFVQYGSFRYRAGAVDAWNTLREREPTWITEAEPYRLVGWLTPDEGVARAHVNPSTHPGAFRQRWSWPTIGLREERPWIETLRRDVLWVSRATSQRLHEASMSWQDEVQQQWQRRVQQRQQQWEALPVATRTQWQSLHEAWQTVDASIQTLSRSCRADTLVAVQTALFEAMHVERERLKAVSR